MPAAQVRGSDPGARSVLNRLQKNRRFTVTHPSANFALSLPSSGLHLELAPDGRLFTLRGPGVCLPDLKALERLGAMMKFEVDDMPPVESSNGKTVPPMMVFQTTDDELEAAFARILQGLPGLPGMETGTTTTTTPSTKRNKVVSSSDDEQPTEVRSARAPAAQRTCIKAAW
jgi:hypothetical protein